MRVHVVAILLARIRSDSRALAIIAIIIADADNGAQSWIEYVTGVRTPNFSHS